MEKNSLYSGSGYRETAGSRPGQGGPGRGGDPAGDGKPAKRGGRLRLVLMTLPFLLLLYLVMLLAAYLDYADRVVDYDILVPGDWAQWDGIDFDREGDSIVLSRDRYMAPHLEMEIGDTLQRQSRVAIHSRGRLGGYSGGAYTLMAVKTTIGDTLVVAVDREGRVALVSDPFASPDFSDARFEGEYEMLLLIDRGTGSSELFLDGRRVVSNTWSGAENHINKLWVGSIWIGGGANYGAPIDHEIYEVVVGSEEMAAVYMPFGSYVLNNLSAWRLLIPLPLWLLFMAVVSALIKQKQNRFGEEGAAAA